MNAYLPRVHGTQRILLHSHDSFGLGHLRRTMTIAEALHSALPDSQILITTGSPCATHFPLPAGIDVIKLPAVTKDYTGRYVPRSLGCDLAPIVQLRKELLRQVHRTFAPDLLIVDHQVLGLCEELDLVLRDARSTGTRTLLGVRDIIDSPETVAREWGSPRVRHALAHEYDRVCVYGTPLVFDPRREYPIPPELAERLQFTGYVTRAAGSTPQGRRARPRVVVTVGGGEDGGMRVDSYFEALELGSVDWDTTVVLGPLFDPARARAFKRRARALANVELHLFHADMPRLLARSDAVVAMAGYNSVVEILQSGLPAVLCPRSFPRREQWIRADRLARLGLAECVPAPTPERLHAAVSSAVTKSRRAVCPIPLDGAARVCAIAAQLLAERGARTSARRSSVQ